MSNVIRATEPLIQITGHGSYETGFLIKTFPFCHGQHTNAMCWISDGKRGQRFSHSIYNPVIGKWSKPKHSEYYKMFFMFVSEDGRYMLAQGVNHYDCTNDELLYIAENYITTNDQKETINNNFINVNGRAWLQTTQRSLVWLNSDPNNEPDYMTHLVYPIAHLGQAFIKDTAAVQIAITEPKRPVGRPRTPKLEDTPNTPPPDTRSYGERTRTSMMVVDLAIDEEIRKYEKEYGPNATHDKYPSVVINIFNKRHETITGYIKEAQRTLEQAIANPDSSNDEIARLQVEVNETTNLYDYIQRAYDAHMVHLQNIFTRCT